MLGMQTGHAAGGQRLGCVLYGHPCRQGRRRQAARLSDQRVPLRVRTSEDLCWGAQACKRPWCPIRSTSTIGFRLCCLHSLKPQNWIWKKCRVHPDLPAQGSSCGPEIRHPANHRVLLTYCLKYLSKPLIPLQIHGKWHH